MAEKLEMMSSNIIQENIDYIASKFPNALKEVIENGKTVKKIDFDILKQELSTILIDDRQERYQMTWPDKKKSILLANSRINATLRPIKEKSVDFDNTKNLYIEGDNLDVLKLLRETYLGKVKMIYIDPPYNTGNDFIYGDDFSQSVDDYLMISGQYDDQGNRLYQNNESNGRFHTEWLNMMYPRLKISRELLSDDGCIVVSLDDNEQSNMIKMLNEIYGESNFIAQIPVLSNPRGRQSSKFIAQTHEYITIYAKSRNHCVIRGEDLTDDQKKEYSLSDKRGNYRLLGLRLRGGRATAAESPTLHFPIYYDIKNDDFYLERKNQTDYEIIPKFENGTLGTWRWSKTKILKQKEDLVVKRVKDRYDVFQKDYLNDDKTMKLKSLWFEKEINYDNSARELNFLGLGDVFDYAKPLYLIKKIVKSVCGDEGTIIDFFSGSATTAHAIIKLNFEENSKLRFIMVQLPEKCAETSEAFKKGFKTICDIGQERIRRAGKKIKEEAGVLGQSLDIGFRVLKLDSSNMNDVYYNPNRLNQGMLEQLVGNVKEDRTALDLLFQVMLELGIELSAKIEEKELNGKTYFVVNENDIVACFDNGIDDNLTKELAKIKPIYAVFKDSSFTTDSANINCEQIFKSISPSTTIKVI